LGWVFLGFGVLVFQCFGAHLATGTQIHTHSGPGTHTHLPAESNKIKIENTKDL